MTSPNIILVGHCGFDSGSLKSLAQSAVPGCTVTRVNAMADLESTDADLLLVNRVLDGRFPTGSGVELIRDLAGKADTPPMMLVSNYEDAQADAESAGALPGFGKSDVANPATAERIAAAVNKHAAG